jgi:hypothetical protein
MEENKQTALDDGLKKLDEQVKKQEEELTLRDNKLKNIIDNLRKGNWEQVSNELKADPSFAWEPEISLETMHYWQKEEEAKLGELKNIQELTADQKEVAEKYTASLKGFLEQMQKVRELQEITTILMQGDLALSWLDRKELKNKVNKAKQHKKMDPEQNSWLKYLEQADKVLTKIENEGGIEIVDEIHKKMQKSKKLGPETSKSLRQLLNKYPKADFLAALLYQDTYENGSAVRVEESIQKLNRIRVSVQQIRDLKGNKRSKVKIKETQLWQILQKLDDFILEVSPTILAISPGGNDVTYGKLILEDLKFIIGEIKMIEKKTHWIKTTKRQQEWNSYISYTGKLIGNVEGEHAAEEESKNDDVEDSSHSVETTGTKTQPSS